MIHNCFGEYKCFRVTVRRLYLTLLCDHEQEMFTFEHLSYNSDFIKSLSTGHFGLGITIESFCPGVYVRLMNSK